MDTRRKQYLINRRFQLRYTLAFVGVALAGFAVSAAVTLHDINAQIESYISEPSADISSTGDIILPVMLRVSAAFSLVILAVIALMSVLYYMRTKRLATELGASLAMMKEGALGFRMGLAGTSDFGDTEDAFNLMLSENGARLASLQRSAAAIEDRVLAVEAAVAEGRDCGPGLEELRGTLAGMDGTISGFKLR